MTPLPQQLEDKKKDPLDEIFIEKGFCGDFKHKPFYKYTCKKCETDEKHKDKVCWKKLENGDIRGCECECRHNNFICTKCWMPVWKVGGRYYFVK